MLTGKKIPAAQGCLKTRAINKRNLNLHQG